MDGTLGQVRHDDQGNARLSAWGWLLVALAIAFSVVVLIGPTRTLLG
jgi:hypothetical protein